MKLVGKSKPWQERTGLRKLSPKTDHGYTSCQGTTTHLEKRQWQTAVSSLPRSALAVTWKCPVGDTSIIKYSDPPKSRVPSERSGAAGGIARKKDRALESTKQGSALWLPCGRCLHAAPGSGHRYVYGILFSMTTLVFFSFLYIFNVSKS